jgi:hypothetical protein
VRPVTLTQVVSDYLSNRDPVTITGFGQITPSINISTSSIARTAPVTVDLRSEYNNYLLQQFGIPLGPNYSCHSSVYTYTDPVASPGDSGGFTLDSNGNAIGVISFASGIGPTDSNFACAYDLRSQEVNDWVRSTIAEIERNPGVKQPNTQYTISMNTELPSIPWRSTNYSSTITPIYNYIKLSSVGDPNIFKGDISFDLSKTGSCLDSDIESENPNISVIPYLDRYAIVSSPDFSVTFSSNDSINLVKITSTDNRSCIPNLFSPTFDRFTISGDSTVPLIKYSNVNNPDATFIRSAPYIRPIASAPLYRALEVPRGMSIGDYFTHTEGLRVLTATRISQNQLYFTRNSSNPTFYLVNRDNTSVTEVPGDSYIFARNPYTITYSFVKAGAFLPSISFNFPNTP